jgi:hypothetical protein
MRLLATILTLLTVLAAAAACGGAPAAPAPTTAPVAPAATSETIPATTAPQPTTAPAATQASGSSAAPGSFAEALANAKAAQTYRVELELKASGQFAALAGDQGAGDQELVLISLNGAVDEQNSDLTLSGAFASLITGFLGFDDPDGVQLLTVGDHSFIRGTLANSTEEKWYDLGESQDVQAPLTPGSLLDSLEQANLNVADFQQTGTETLDNQQCTVYEGDREAVIAAFGSVGANQGEPLDPSTVDDASMEFYICPDGYLHQMTMSLTAHEPETPDQKGTFALNLHIYDIDSSDINIVAPTDAEPLQLPGIDVSTPTSTP